MAVARATSMSSRRASLHTPSRQDAIPEFSILVASGFRGTDEKGEESEGGAWSLPFFCTCTCADTAPAPWRQVEVPGLG
jgi:hypothetical protein